MQNLKSEGRSRVLTLDITYKCNLACVNCSRACGVAKTDEVMTIDQIKNMVDESINLKWQWKMIKLAGGEPTLHPDLLKIIDILMNYRNKYSCIIQLCTNGIRKDIIDSVPKFEFIDISNSSKKNNNVTHHNLVYKAPIDFGLSIDYSKIPCNYVPICGICLNRYGYYLSGGCAAIDRVFGFNIGVKTLNEVLNSEFKVLENQQKILCPYCGHIWKKVSSSQIISETWKDILKKYTNEKPQLSIYGE